ncbi:hypothetical protein WA1_34925 [Scytonema hofmannii PCC 7110]|uniref:DUF4760 domain-containing protein n=1 Tax=Scytonema hofmannii PCC 7110 TaxID=128403 RepID=A0A139X275_9CYAN|nr:DUF4760 domain-containing protein [Scytonema hofmannii]KYC38798.1 hypothetical protein WA1_34925 [Scytonema hofmannii PCC 7110]
MKHQSDSDKIGQFNISIPIRVGFLSAILAGLLTFLFYFAKQIDKNGHYKETLNFFVTALTASAGVTSAFYAFKSIEQSKESQKIESTSVYISRWNDVQYLPVRKTTTDIINLIKEQPDNQREKLLLEYLETHPDKRQDITNVLNFLEEMALCIEKGIIKEEILYDFYRFIVIEYCEIFGVHIAQRRRERKNERIFRALTDLCDRWHKRWKTF